MRDKPINAVPQVRAEYDKSVRVEIEDNYMRILVGGGFNMRRYGKFTYIEQTYIALQN